MYSIVRLSIAALLSWAAIAQHSSVGIFLDFDTPPAAAPVTFMKQEVERLLKSSGVSLDWRLTKENHGQESFARLVVVKFKGSCKAEDWSQGAGDFGSIGESRTLAATRVEHGQVLPYSEVKCDEVRRALEYLRPGADRVVRQRAFGAAMGRVVAHELYHILANTTSHASSGLAKASHSLEDLIAPNKTGFSPAESELIGTP